MNWKKMAAALALCLVMASLIAAPALAAPKKVKFVPQGDAPGRGSVEFSVSDINQLSAEVTLRKVTPGATYDFYFARGGTEVLKQSITVSPKGTLRGGFFLASLSPGTHEVGMKVTLHNETSAVYLTKDFPNSATLTIK
jgi:hypothetical protein